MNLSHKEFTLSTVKHCSLSQSWDCYLHKQWNCLLIPEKKNWPLTQTLHSIPECLGVFLCIETRSRFYSSLLKIQHINFCQNLVWDHHTQWTVTPTHCLWWTHEWVNRWLQYLSHLSTLIGSKSTDTKCKVYIYTRTKKMGSLVNFNSWYEANCECIR